VTINLIDLDLDDDGSTQVMAVHQCCEATEIDQPASDGLIRVGVPALKDFPQVVQRLKDGAFPRAVRAEKQRDGFEVDNLPAANPLEVLDFDIC